MTEPLEVLTLQKLFDRLASPELTTPATQRAAPFVSFTPTPGVLYMDVRPILRAEPERLGIGFASSDRNRGIFQVDIVAPDEKGETPALRVAALVAARFAKGTKLALGTVYLQVYRKPTIAAPVKDAPWVRYPVSIPFEIIS